MSCAKKKTKRVTLNRMTSCVRPPGGMSATDSGMKWHFDYQPKPGCMTVVYVLYSNGGGSVVHGGAVVYSNRPQGTISRKPAPRADSYSTLHIPSNALYILPASHVEHAVTALLHDRNSEVGGPTRYALVMTMKFKSDACRQLAKLAWAQTCGGVVGTLYCDQCLTSDEEVVCCFEKKNAHKPTTAGMITPRTSLSGRHEDALVQRLLLGVQPREGVLLV